MHYGAQTRGALCNGTTSHYTNQPQDIEVFTTAGFPGSPKTICRIASCRRRPILIRFSMTFLGRIQDISYRMVFSCQSARNCRLLSQVTFSAVSEFGVKLRLSISRQVLQYAHPTPAIPAAER
jgi:hypothetical protein